MVAMKAFEEKRRKRNWAIIYYCERMTFSKVLFKKEKKRKESNKIMKLWKRYKKKDDIFKNK